jgi:hypothetical protein
MRSVTRVRSRDEGAVLVWVALMMVVLIGFAALVIDVGALYAEKRQLQNGADAGALAVAQDCTNGGCGSGYVRADEYADLNAKDGAAAVDQVCGRGPGLAGCPDPPPAAAANASGWVRVRTSTETSDGGDEVAFLLAPIVTALTGSTVRASAVAAWGPAGAGDALALTFSTCEFEGLGGDPANGVVPEDRTIIYFHGNDVSEGVGNCRPGSPSGADGPGGFGWLVDVAECQVSINPDGWVDQEDGRDPNELCIDALEDAFQNKTSLRVVMYDNYCRPNGTDVLSGKACQYRDHYHVAGIAAFEVLGYKLQRYANGIIPPNPRNCRIRGGNTDCMYVKFVTTALYGGEFGPPGAGDYGVRIIKMVG